jgi:hypothetical protein
MKIHMSRRLFLAAAVVGALALFAAAFFVTLTVRSVVAGPSASPGGPVPNPGHAWTELQDHGIDGGDYWLGTIDMQALELRVNGERALRLEPNDTSPNVIGGYSGNSLTSGVVGAAIGGGGQSGYTNRVTDNGGTIAGGANNQAGDDAGTTDDAGLATVGGGSSNTASAEHATVGGGYGNTASAWAATVGGGWSNSASGDSATVGGGDSNSASGAFNATVGGGYQNTASGFQTTVAGGTNNTASGDIATVGGGTDNTASAWVATVGGGKQNTASGDQGATVAGGQGHNASGSSATVGGGDGNTASGDGAIVGGGDSNTASGRDATIAGGGRSDWFDPATANRATDAFCTVGGGANNQAGDNAGTTDDAASATVGGGESNTASGNSATVGGGNTNTASNQSATVGGGASNIASGDQATVGGGGGNTANGVSATVGGGDANTAGGGTNATVGGGHGNIAGGSDATVGGGNSNTASGNSATVPGGSDNTAAGDLSFAAGRRATANNQGCFVWGDSTDADVASTGNDQFIVRASGGVWFGSTSSPDLTAGFINTSTGGYLSTGGAWTDSSDRDQKENFTPVDGQEVLASLAEMPITTWNYKAEDASISHMGPVAQDFYAAFGLGQDELHIASLDSSGVALAAIQGLYEVVQEQATRIQALEEENGSLQQRLDDLETRVTALDGGPGTSSGSGGPLSSTMPAGGLLLVGLFVGGLVLVQRRRAGGRS